jgi:hypothetical protein
MYDMRTDTWDGELHRGDIAVVTGVAKGVRPDEFPIGGLVEVMSHRYDMQPSYHVETIPERRGGWLPAGVLGLVEPACRRVRGDGVRCAGRRFRLVDGVGDCGPSTPWYVRAGFVCSRGIGAPLWPWRPEEHLGFYRVIPDGVKCHGRMTGPRGVLLVG